MSNNLPALMRVPGIGQQSLDFIAKANGVTFLKNSSLKMRYLGSPAHAVDINGRAYHDKKDLIKLIGPTEKKVRGKKKSRIEIQDVKRFFVFENTPQMYDDLPTILPQLSTNNGKLPTPPAKTYTVKKKVVRSRILSYLNTVKGCKELYFWTITFPPGITDNLAYQAYNIWLTTLRQRGLLREYIWVAERQPETGRVHFHIAIPHKMPVTRANAMMRGTLKNMVKKRLLDYSLHKLARYNGVDISKNRGTKRVTNFAQGSRNKSLANYLTKYVTKNNGEFSHLAWHNSRGYSALFNGMAFTRDEIITHFLKFIDTKAAFENDFFVWMPWRDRPPDFFTRHLFQVNSYFQSLN